MQELRFDNRVAVVTGAGRGLGRAYALLLAARGAKVIVNDNGGALSGASPDAGPAQEVVAEIKTAGGEATACSDSVASLDGAKAIIGSALDAYGRIDILVHNAGNTREAKFEEMTQEDFDSVVNTHLMGGFHLSRQAYPHMTRQGYGRIVLTSSMAGLYGSRGSVNYGVSKCGLVGLSNLIALEGGKAGVKSNVILPGAITRMATANTQVDTSMFPSTLTPDSVAPVVAYLCHESCAVNGELYTAAAGRIARVVIGEARGLARLTWTIEDVVENLDVIRDLDDLLIFPSETATFDHVKVTMGMARKVGA